MPALAAAFLPRLSSLAHLSPDAAVLLATAGLCLIFLELNRPGLVLPGAGGLLVLLLAAAVLLRYPFRGWAIALLVLSTATLLGNLWRRLPLWMLGSATLGLAAAARFLVSPGADRQVHTAVALPCGVAIGGLGAALSRVALRARRAKRVN